MSLIRFFKKVVVFLIFLDVLSAQELKITREEPLEITAKKILGNSKTKEIVYVGNVVLKHAGNILEANKLTILPGSDKIIAEGNVSFIDGNNTIEMKGQYVEYLKSSKHVMMKESPVLSLSDKEGIRTTVKSDVMELFSKEERAVIYGNVEVTREDMKILCALVHYDKGEDKVILEGKPLVFKGDDRYEGDKITIFTKDRKLIADSNVKAVVYFEEKKK